MTDKQCKRCGEVNPAEIHTCSPNYVDRRQWKYDPMTGEPLIDGWPLYSGLPEPEPQEPQIKQRTGDCLLTSVCAAEGHRIQKPQHEWRGLTADEIWSEWGEQSKPERDTRNFVAAFARAIEAKLKEKNT